MVVVLDNDTNYSGKPVVRIFTFFFFLVSGVLILRGVFEITTSRKLRY